MDNQYLLSIIDKTPRSAKMICNVIGLEPNAENTQRIGFGLYWLARRNQGVDFFWQGDTKFYYRKSL